MPPNAKLNIYNLSPTQLSSGKPDPGDQFKITDADAAKEVS